MGRSCLPGRRRGLAGVKSGFIPETANACYSWAQASRAAGGLGPGREPC